MLLAIAKLESDLGRHTVNDYSTARGSMQIIRTEFLRMVEAYGARNENNLIGYLAFLPPESREANGLAHDIGTLQSCSYHYMKTPAYHRSHTLPQKIQTELLRLNNRPIVQLLFVADRLADGFDNAFPRCASRPVTGENLRHNLPISLMFMARPLPTSRWPLI